MSKQERLGFFVLGLGATLAGLELKQPEPKYVLALFVTVLTVMSFFATFPVEK